MKSILIVVGDVHGDFNQFNEPLKKYKELKSKKQNVKLIYLGDYIDRGNDELLIYKQIMNNINDKNIIFLRGNHEEYNYYNNIYFKQFHDLHLPLYYYNSEYNILFSHNKANIDINDIEYYNNNKNNMTNLILYGGNIKNTKYKNIYGHTHNSYLNNNDINNFEKGIIKNLSIDVDASKFYHKFIISYVGYLMIDNDKYMFSTKIIYNNNSNKIISIIIILLTLLILALFIYFCVKYNNKNIYAINLCDKKF